MPHNLFLFHWKAAEIEALEETKAKMPEALYTTLEDLPDVLRQLPCERPAAAAVAQ